MVFVWLIDGALEGLDSSQLDAALGHLPSLLSSSVSVLSRPSDISVGGVCHRSRQLEVVVWNCQQ